MLGLSSWYIQSFVMDATLRWYYVRHDEAGIRSSLLIRTSFYIATLYSNAVFQSWSLFEVALTDVAQSCLHHYVNVGMFDQERALAVPFILHWLV